jgi:hypothetical protein
MKSASSPGARPTGGIAPGRASALAPGIGAGLKEQVGPADDALEREADRVADVVARGGVREKGYVGWAAASLQDSTPHRQSLNCTSDDERIRRAPKDAGASAVQPEPAEAQAQLPAKAPAPAPAAAPEASSDKDTTSATTPSLLVDDDAQADRGQMRKSEFMASLRAQVCATVDAALADTGRDSQGCPWIDHWLGYYEERSASQIERSLHRYAPEAAGVASAREYIRIVAARVRESAERWAKTGEITGMPDDMPGSAMLGGSLLGSFGGMFFKARPGGARRADPASVREQLGRGQSLPGSVRAPMENAFGTSFANVRLHTDGTAARLSNQLNARAFAVGPHVAFGGGEFQPGTLTGDALIAHELAHVVQQGHGNALPHAREARHESDSVESSSALEHDADRSAAGAMAATWGGARGRLSELGRQARPRMRSGLQLQRCASTPKKSVTSQAKAGAKAPGEAEAKKSVLEQRNEAVAEAGGLLRTVDAWMSSAQKKQEVPDIKGVVNLDEAQADNVAKAIELLARAEPMFGATALNALPAKLDETVGHAREARKLYGGAGGNDPDSSMFAMRSHAEVIQGKNASEEASEMVKKAGETLDVTEIRKHTDAIDAALADMKDNPANTDDGVDTVIANVKAAKLKIAELRGRVAGTPKAVGRILFVLRSFLALNAPKRASGPTAAEIKTYKGTLGTMSSDFSTVFAEGKTTRGYEAFGTYAEVLDLQLAEREKMAAAKVTPASPVPTQGNAEDYFASLKDKPNAEVFAAYTDYASAFFYHRVVDKFDDMNVGSVSDLYSRPLSVMGLRPLVCTGYALLGSHLLTRAGATFKEFIVAVRATDADIVGNKIDEGHALAHMKRKGKDFFVSNHLIVDTEDEGIGSDAVAWDKKDAPLHKTAGATIPGTNSALEAQLGKLAEKIRNRP